MKHSLFNNFSDIQISNKILQHKFNNINRLYNFEKQFIFEYTILIILR